MPLLKIEVSSSEICFFSPFQLDPSITRLVDKLTWYVIPVLNPDGYEYSHTTNRMWRKTLSPQNYFCKGADPNRNWDAHFGTTGDSDV